MIVVKFEIDSDNKELAYELEERLRADCSVSILESKGLFGSEAVVVAIIATTPAIAKAIASIIQDYLNRNKHKKVTIENGKLKKTYEGCTVQEIKELETAFSSSAQEIKSD